MKNYQSLYYKDYYAQSPDGGYIPVSRKECFAPGEDPTADNPFRQRWFYDPEASYAVRLERSQRSEELYLTNAASLKKEERQRDKRDDMIELDQPRYNDDGDEGTIEIEDESADIEAIIENRDLLSTLFAALDQYSPGDRELWDFLIKEEKKQVIADYFGITLDGVRYREQRLHKNLRSDKTIQNILKKF